LNGERAVYLAVYFHSVLSQCTCTVYFHSILDSVLSQCTSTVYFHSVLSQCTFTVYFHSILSQCTFTVYFHRILDSAIHSLTPTFFCCHTGTRVPRIQVNLAFGDHLYRLRQPYTHRVFRTRKLLRKTLRMKRRSGQGEGEGISSVNSKEQGRVVVSGRNCCLSG